MLIDVSWPRLVEADARRAEAEAVVAEPELGGEPADAVVRGQDDVVVAVDADAVEVGRGREPAELAVALVDRDGNTRGGPRR